MLSVYLAAHVRILDTAVRKEDLTKIAFLIFIYLYLVFIFIQ
jgi:hypothetical protein